MGITFERFIEIAKEVRALDILECWDRYSFDTYVKMCGPITEEGAYNLCGFVEAVSRDEAAAGEYFSRR